MSFLCSLQVQKPVWGQRDPAGGAEVQRLHAGPVLLAGLPESGLDAAQGGVQSRGFPGGWERVI